MHTVILSDQTLKKWGLSSFAFQSFYGFIGTLNKKNPAVKNPSQEFKNYFCFGFL